jgi:hypothetical protein
MRQSLRLPWVTSVLLLTAAGLSTGCPSGESLATPTETGDGSTAADLGGTPDAATSPTTNDGGGTTTPIAVQNPSFEAPFLNAGTYVTNAVPMGWQSYGAIDNGSRAVGALNPSSTQLYLDPAPDGRNVGVVFLLDRVGDPSYFANSPAGLQQTLTDTLAPSSDYTLIVDVGNIKTDGSPQHPFDFSGFPNYRIDLLAGGQVLASDSNMLRPAEGRFLQSTVRYTTGAQHPQLGMPLGIRLVNLNSAVGTEVNFDNVRLQRTSR